MAIRVVATRQLVEHGRHYAYVTLDLIAFKEQHKTEHIANLHPPQDKG
jgi:hypothetical protein